MENTLKYFQKRCKDLKMCLDTCRDKDGLEKVIAHNEKAVEALKKQIPAEPIRKLWELPRCPSCGAELGEWLGDGYTKDWDCKTVCGDGDVSRPLREVVS